MNDKKIAAKAEVLTAKAEKGDTDALADELNHMSMRDRAAVARKMDQINARHRAHDSSLPDIVIAGDDDVCVVQRDGAIAHVRPGEGVVVQGRDGRVRETTDALGNKRSFEYGTDGKLVSVTEENGSTWTTTDGHTWTTKDGSVWKGKIQVWKDGTYRYQHEDGTATAKYPDGSVSVAEPNGRVILTRPDGTKQEYRADGTPAGGVPAPGGPTQEPWFTGHGEGGSGVPGSGVPPAWSPSGAPRPEQPARPERR
ncbi:MAG TPA: RHS repeat domain-containing protein [Candidatus Obscuribacterales bacterium]